jgi:hypothetical protein
VKWIALAMFGCVGLIAFIAGCIWGYQRFTLYRDGVSVQGVVIENTQTRSRDKDGHTSVSYYPVVEFTAQGGEKHRFTGSTGSSTADYEAGAKVAVRYDPGNPSRAQITDFAQFWLGPLGVGVFGFMFLAGGIGAFILIKGSDEAFGPQFKRKMDAVQLSVGKEGIRLDGQVDSVRKQAGSSAEEYVIVCRATLPGGISQHRFEAEPIFFNPGPWIIGKSVEIYVDPRNKERYAVLLEPLLAALAKGNER